MYLFFFSIVGFRHLISKTISIDEKFKGTIYHLQENRHSYLETHRKSIILAVLARNYNLVDLLTIYMFLLPLASDEKADWEYIISLAHSQGFRKLAVVIDDYMTSLNPNSYTPMHPYTCFGF